MELTTVQNDLFLEEMEEVEAPALFWGGVAVVGVALIIIAC